MFRALVQGAEVKVEKVGDIEGLIYKVSDPAFAVELIKAGFVRRYRKNQPLRMRTPEELIDRIELVEKAVMGDTFTYRITTKEGVVSLTNSELCSITMVKQKFMTVGYVVTFQGNSKTASDLNDLLMHLMSVEVIVSEELLTEEELRGDEFMELLRSLPVVIALEDHVGYRDVWDHEGVYVVSTKTMGGLLRELGWGHITLSALGSLLLPIRLATTSR